MSIDKINEWFLKQEIFIDEGGTKFHRLNGILHRDNGPAIEHISGNKSWYINGKLHREDGPAIENATGVKRWYFHGKLLSAESQEEFEKLIKLKAFW